MLFEINHFFILKILANMVSRSKIIPEPDSDGEIAEISISLEKKETITWSQLFKQYSSKNQKMQLIFGLVCSFLTGFLIPISYIFLGEIINENGDSNVSMKKIGWILLYFVSNLLITSVFAYFERKCLNGYAGNPISIF